MSEFVCVVFGKRFTIFILEKSLARSDLGVRYEKGRNSALFGVLLIALFLQLCFLN